MGIEFLKPLKESLNFNFHSWFQLSILNLNRLDKANGEVEFLKVAREKAEDDIARFRNELASLTEARHTHVMEQERQNSEMQMLQNDIKVRILCFKFSLNPLKFSLTGETDKKND